jgi:hypothetical protein
MNSKPVLLAAISYAAVLTLLACFLTLLTIVGITAAPASAQSAPVFLETAESDLPFKSFLSSPVPASRPGSDAAPEIATAGMSRPPASPSVDRTLAEPHAEPAVPVRTAVILNFKSLVPEAFWQALLYELTRREISGSLDGPVLWARYDRLPAGSDFPEIVQIRFEGNCYSPYDGPDGPRVGPLGWTYLASGRIEPLVVVDCDRVRGILAAALRNQPRIGHQQALARAISRIIFHELTHIRTQSAAHSPAGIEKARLTAVELTQPRIP